jgi:hypothetical protein
MTTGGKESPHIGESNFRGDGGIRTLTGGGLSALPLPIGLRPLNSSGVLLLCLCSAPVCPILIAWSLVWHAACSSVVRACVRRTPRDTTPLPIVHMVSDWGRWVVDGHFSSESPLSRGPIGHDTSQCLKFLVPRSIHPATQACALRPWAEHRGRPAIDVPPGPTW